MHPAALGIGSAWMVFHGELMPGAVGRKSVECQYYYSYYRFGQSNEVPEAAGCQLFYMTKTVMQPITTDISNR